MLQQTRQPGDGIAVLRWPAIGVAAMVLVSVSASWAVDRYLLKVEAFVQGAPAQITLQWDTQLAGYTNTIYRRVFGQEGATWGAARARVGYPQRIFADTNVTPGVVYEYRIDRPYYDATHEQANAYICAGMQAPLAAGRGKVLIVVDDTMAAALAPEIERLHLDLIGEGWSVARRTYQRHGTGTPAGLRALIQGEYAADSNNLKSVFLLGKLPRVQSGLTAPDGHANQPQDADVFYADMDGVWTDADTNGVYDQNYLPGNQRVEVQLGRTDLADMPAWPVNEQTLLRLYLNKDHCYRSGRITASRTGIYDAVNYLCQEGSHVIAMMGVTNSALLDFSATVTNACLWGVDFWDWNGANYNYSRLKIQFTINFGSGKLYWRNSNNAMRGILAQPTYGLTCGWGSRPFWYFHQMAMGSTIGYCAYRTQNNYVTFNDYLPQCSYWFGGGVHVNLMGDPTLRLHVVPPPADLHVAAVEGNAALAWAASRDPRVLSYDVYRADDLTGAYARLNAAPVAATNYLDSVTRAGTVYYMVRAVNLERSTGGSYTNASAGVFNCLTLAGSDNAPPAGQSGATNTMEDTAVTLRLAGSDPDGDTVNFGVIEQPAHGWLGGASNVWTYKPDPNFNGQDVFNYMVYDRMSVARGGMVTVTVAAVNDAPTAATQSVMCAQSGTNITLAGSDVDGDPLSYFAVALPQHGTLSGALPGVTYTPVAVFQGTDIFTFAVTDGIATSTPAAVTIFVLPEPCAWLLAALAAGVWLCASRHST